MCRPTRRAARSRPETDRWPGSKPCPLNDRQLAAFVPTQESPSETSVAGGGRVSLPPAAIGSCVAGLMTVLGPSPLSIIDRRSATLPVPYRVSRCGRQVVPRIYQQVPRFRRIRYSRLTVYVSEKMLIRLNVNAGAKMHRRAGVKIHHGCWQQGAPFGAPCCVLVIRRESCPVNWRPGRRVVGACSA
jgi:hypothetical protein